MKKLKVHLENCYGIKKIEHEFSFDKKSRTYAIYAQNGVMKTSFAKTFKDLIEGKTTGDTIYSERLTIRKIINEANSELSQEQVFVIEPYNESYISKNESTLIVKKRLKRKI